VQCKTARTLDGCVAFNTRSTDHGRARQLRPPRNNQKRGIRLAADYELDNWSLEALVEIAREGQARSEETSVFA
jgi:hypothetical protein